MDRASFLIVLFLIVMEGDQDRMVSGRRPRSHVDGDEEEEDVQSFDGEEVTTILLEEIGESHTEE